MDGEWYSRKELKGNRRLANLVFSEGYGNVGAVMEVT